jgi:HTH-type transcriptional regulator / antitoxin HigA
MPESISETEVRIPCVHPIKTEADYEAALAEIGTLMDCEPNTPECDRLDMLATLVCTYEEEHHKIEPPDYETEEVDDE